MKYFLVAFTFIVTVSKIYAKQPIRIIGYYCGTSILPDSFETNKLTHLIYSFSNLCGNRICLHSATDTLLIKRMVDFKKKNPQLKIMISMGGWSGCAPCSNVFNSEKGRTEFAESVKELCDYFHLDGLDLDWEYPAIKGFPGHTYQLADKKNFTALLKKLREINEEKFELSFAAGGFTACIDSSFEWDKINSFVSFVNIMSYDLVHGYSTVSGHHTPLYSTPEQIESTDHAVKMLLKAGVPANKLVIGAAFYGRIFQITEGSKVDLYQPCKFLHSFSWKYAADTLSTENGYELKFDSVAGAPYAINLKRNLLASYDNEQSVALKTKYVKDNNLGGIMFGETLERG